MQMKFEIEIPKQTWRTDGQTDKVNPVYPSPSSLGGGIKMGLYIYYKNDKSFKLMLNH